MVPNINLLPKQEKSQSDSKLLYILLGIIVLLLLSFFTWQYFSARAEIISLEKKETALITQRDQLKAGIDLTMSENQGTLEQSIEIVDLISYPLSPIIDEIKVYQPNNSFLREYVFEEKSVKVIIDFETLKDVSQFVSRLANSAYFTDGQVISITNYELGADVPEETNFDIVPRQSAEINLLINEEYLATGGVQ